MSTVGSPQDQDEPGQTPLFLSSLSEDDLRKLYTVGEMKQFAAGDTPLAEGDTDTSMYILLEGRAEVSIPGKKGWIKVATLIPGSVFGELSFFDRMPRSARVSVLADATVLRFSEDSFQRLSQSDPAIALGFILELGKVLSLRVRHMNQLVLALSK